jgi:prevent-host-death family protein
MEVPISEAKARLTDLVRRAEAGEDIVLMRHGRPAARLVPIRVAVDRAARLAAIERARAAATAKLAGGGPSAARSQDFLYDEEGLPRR